MKYLAEKFDKYFTNAFIVAALRQLSTTKHVEFGLGERENMLSITPAGMRAVEKCLKDVSSVVSRYRDEGISAFDEEMIPLAVPASDRSVTIDHNSAEFKQASELIDAARSHLRQNNEVGEAFGDDKDIAIAELDQLQVMIDQPVVRTALLAAFARRTLGWITEKGAGTIISELSKKILAIVIGWLS